MSDVTTEQAVDAIHELGESDFRIAIRALLIRRSKLYRGSGDNARKIRSGLLLAANAVGEAFEQ